MNNEIAFSNTSGLASIADFGAGLANTAQTELVQGNGGVPILKMDRRGDWSYGMEGIEPEAGSLWAVNPMSLSHGYISWLEGKPAGEMMTTMAKPLPPVETMAPAPGEPWAKEYQAQLRCVEGQDKDEQVVFKGSSLGIQDCFAKLVPQIVARIAGGSGEIVPVVALSTTSYQHTKYGKIYKPVLEVDHWETMDGTSAPAQIEESIDDLV